MTVKRVGTVGYFLRGNIGDEIFMQVLQKNQHGIHFDPLHQEKNRTAPIRHFPNILRKKLPRGVKRSLHKRRRALGISVYRYDSLLRECDAVLFGPGGLISLEEFPLVLEDLYKVLKRTGIPLYCYGLGVQASASRKKNLKDTLANWTKFLGLSDTVYVRDRFSKHLLEESNIHNNVRVVFDLAYVYPLPASRKNETKTVGINLKSVPQLLRYRDRMVNLVEFFCDQGYQVLLIPFQEWISDMAEENDLAILEYVLRCVKDRKAVRILNGLSPTETLWYLGAVDFFVGARYHSLLFAMRYGVPSCGIVYAPKVHSLMSEYYGLEKCVVQPDEVSTIPELFMDRERIRKEILSRNPLLERTAAMQLNAFLDRIVC